MNRISEYISYPNIEETTRLQCLFKCLGFLPMKLFIEYVDCALDHCLKGEPRDIRSRVMFVSIHVFIDSWAPQSILNFVFFVATDCFYLLFYYVC